MTPEEREQLLADAGAYLCGVMFLDRLPLVDGRNTIPFGIARTWKTHITRMQVGLVGGKDHVQTSMEPTHKLRHVLRRSARKPGSQEARANEKRIEELLEPILSAANATVIAAYEGKIENLKHQNRIIADKLQNSVVPSNRFEEIIEHFLQFLANPWNLWACGHYHMKRLVLRLAFSEPIAYCRNEGYQTPKTSIPFKVLESVRAGKSDLVRPIGATSNTNFDALFETLEEWDTYLKAEDIDLNSVELQGDSCAERATAGLMLRGSAP